MAAQTPPCSRACRRRPRKARALCLLHALVGVGVAAASGALAAARPALVLPRWSPRRQPRAAAAALVGQPHFKPAYGFEPASPLGPRPEAGEAVPGLRAFLAHLGLEGHLAAANAWCGEMGAAVLSEVVESVEDLAEALPVSDEEADQLCRRARLAMSALESRGELVPQEPVVPPSDAFAGRVLVGKRKASKGSNGEESA